MVQQQLVPQALFQTFLGNDYGSVPSTGDESSVVLFGEVDTRYMQQPSAGFVYADVIEPSYWLVDMREVHVGGNKVANTCQYAKNGNCLAVIDTGRWKLGASWWCCFCFSLSLSRACVCVCFVGVFGVFVRNLSLYVVVGVFVCLFVFV
jgi:Eukaryotic aspartyl protease